MNKILAEILREHAYRYPLMEPTDAVKLVYQHVMGPGHMVPDPQTSLARLKAELEETPSDFVPLTEDLGGTLVRLNLAAMEAAGLTAEGVNRLFVETANEVRGSRETLLEGLNELRKVCAEGVFAFDSDALEVYLKDYAAKDYPAVSHSEAYRAAYEPAYRVVSKHCLKYLMLIETMEYLLEREEKVCVAIDGRAASGKSTLGDMLQRMFGANLFHMDDYFLRKEQRTAQRLAEPGGNVDYERFKEEVLQGIRSGRPFAYRPFDCSVMEVGAPVDVLPNPVTIVEGSYSLHPALADGYDLKVFLDISPETQSDRILMRNGESMHRRFVETWIPLEEKYFDTLNIREKCDFVIENE